MNNQDVQFKEGEFRVFTDGISLAELEMPPGCWYLSNQDDIVFVAGPKPPELYLMARENGIDANELEIDKVPTSNPDEVCIGGMGEVARSETNDE